VVRKTNVLSARDEARRHHADRLPLKRASDEMFPPTSRRISAAKHFDYEIPEIKESQTEPNLNKFAFPVAACTISAQFDVAPQFLFTPALPAKFAGAHSFNLTVTFAATCRYSNFAL
jgi:hypothetical protein